jgi:outer membrane receptor protein involved in Fe transport
METTEEKSVVLDPVEVSASSAELGGDYRPRTSVATGFRAQPVLDTPFSVAGFSSDFAQDIQARSLLDIARTDPSVSPAGDPLWFDRVRQCPWLPT